MKLNLYIKLKISNLLLSLSHYTSLHYFFTPNLYILKKYKIPIAVNFNVLYKLYSSNPFFSIKNWQARSPNVDTKPNKFLLL